ncbi:hypothetical protein ACNKHQ_13210 [Shigella flexneri]
MTSHTLIADDDQLAGGDDHNARADGDFFAVPTTSACRPSCHTVMRCARTSRFCPMHGSAGGRISSLQALSRYASLPEQQRIDEVCRGLSVAADGSR